MRSPLWWLTIGLLGSCSGEEPHDCDNGVPTCDSSLLIKMPDPRSEFTLTVKDDVGLDLVVDCPLPEGVSNVQGDYTLTCQAGALAIHTFRHFSDTVEVQLEELPAKDYPVNQQKGGDFCGNPCSNGTIQL